MVNECTDSSLRRETEKCLENKMARRRREDNPRSTLWGNCTAQHNVTERMVLTELGSGKHKRLGVLAERWRSRGCRTWCRQSTVPPGSGLSVPGTPVHSWQPSTSTWHPQATGHQFSSFTCPYPRVFCFKLVLSVKTLNSIINGLNEPKTSKHPQHLQCHTFLGTTPSLQ